MNYFDCNRADSQAVVVNNCSGTKCKAAATSLTATSMELTFIVSRERTRYYVLRYKAVRVLALRSRARAIVFPPRSSMACFTAITIDRIYFWMRYIYQQSEVFLVKRGKIKITSKLSANFLYMYIKSQSLYIIWVKYYVQMSITFI